MARWLADCQDPLFTTVQPISTIKIFSSTIQASPFLIKYPVISRLVMLLDTLLTKGFSLQNLATWESLKQDIVKFHFPSKKILKLIISFINYTDTISYHFIDKNLSFGVFLTNSGGYPYSPEKKSESALSIDNTVNSLVSDHPWCMTKWSLTGGGRLRERSIK